MLYYFDEFLNYAEITGFRNTSFRLTNETLQNLRKREHSKVEIQFFDADLIATKDHLYFALLSSLQAFKNGVNISKSIAMEMMLYASAQRQIKKAIQKIGIKPETNDLAVVVVGEKREEVISEIEEISCKLRTKLDDAVLAMSEYKRKRIVEAFNITNLELETISKADDFINLVVEQVALLVTRL